MVAEALRRVSRLSVDAGMGGIALGAAVAVGALATAKPLYAAAFVLSLFPVMVIVANIDALPVLLVFTMFVESVSLGPGLRLDRLAGLIAIVALAGYVLTRGIQGLKPSLLLGVVGAYGAWILTSAYWASDPGAVFRMLASYLLSVAYMLVFALIVRHEHQLRAIFVTLAFGSLVFGVVSFARYAGSNGVTRGSGLQSDPNFFAVYQVVALPAVLVLAARERRPERRLVLFGIAGVIVLSVFSSLSRTGLLALLIVLALTLLLPSRLFFHRPGQKLVYAAILVSAAGIALLAGSTSLLQRAQSILDPGSAAGNRGAGRLDLWRAGLHGWREHPFRGLGAGNFPGRAVDLLQTTPGVDTSQRYIKANQVHNAYLEALTELGPIGLALFSLLLVLTASSFARALRRARAAGAQNLERLSAALLVSLTAFALSAIFLSDQLSRVFWILIGLALALDVMTRRLVPVPESA